MKTVKQAFSPVEPLTMRIIVCYAMEPGHRPVYEFNLSEPAAKEIIRIINAIAEPTPDAPESSRLNDNRGGGRVVALYRK